METTKDINGFSIKIVNADAGVISQLGVDISKVEDHRLIDKCFGPYTDGDQKYFYLDCTGKWCENEEKSIESLRNNVIKKIKRMEKNQDLRPSQVRKLDLLKKFIG